MATPLDNLAHVIQLSVAPVFLLTSVGTILVVLSTRLGRIVDRPRVLGDRVTDASAENKRAIQSSWRHWSDAVTWQTLRSPSARLPRCSCACSIVMAFMSYMVEVSMTLLVAMLFVLAMLSFIVAFIWFLREVLLAAGAVHIEATGPHR